MSAAAVKNDGESGCIRHMTNLDAFRDAPYPENIRLNNIQTTSLDNLFEGPSGI